MSETHPRRIYLLSPKALSQETIAVTFAKTSRSPKSFEEIAAELSDEKAARFHEKWVIGYGHASVAEHAVLHIAFENVSRLAIECIESNRLASYTEKSTRYQKWAPDSYHLPQEVRGTRFETLYQDTCAMLFRTYQESLEPVKAVVARRFPPRVGESEARHDNRIRSKYVDVCRFLLPAASLANVGMTVNARALEHALRKMLSHRLAEVRAIGERLKARAQQELPTLVKYADARPYFIETAADLAARGAALPASPPGESLQLIAYDPEGEDRVLAAALYPYAGTDFDTALAHVRRLDQAGKEALAEALLGRRGPHDAPLRALEHAWYTFDAMMDQGAYFEVKRHRMMTQTPQRLTADLGYAVPRLIVEAGFLEAYRRAMDAAALAYRELAGWNPEVAAYLVPNGFNRRLLMTLNLREAFHFCELRSERNAHFSVRRLAIQMAEQIRAVHPILGRYIRLPEEGWQEIEAAHFADLATAPAL